MSQQINLFNPIFLKQKKIFTARPMLEALGAIVLGVLALSWYAGRQIDALEQSAALGKDVLAKREVRLINATEAFKPRQKSPQLAAEVAQAEAELKALREVDAVLKGGALGNTAGYAEYFRAFARQNVSGLWLTGFTIVGAGNDIGVQGKAMQPTLIPNYIARLTSEKIMHGKTFASLEIARPEAMSSLAPAAAAAPAPVAAPISPELAALAGITFEKPKEGKGGNKSSKSAAPVQAAPPAPPVTAAQIDLSPYVQFNLQTTAAVEEGGK